MGAKSRKKVGGLRAPTGADRLPHLSVSIGYPTHAWQVTFGSREAAADEAQRRAKHEGVRYYVLKFVESRGPVRYSAIDEEVFLMCGGFSGWGRPVVVYNSQGELDGSPQEKHQG